MTLEVCGELVAPLEVDALRVSLLDDTRLAETFAGVYELGTCDIDSSVQLPVEVDLPDQAGDVWIGVQGLSDGVVVTRVEVRLEPPTLDGPEVTVVPVNLTRDCLGVDCAVGQTCRDGVCVVTPWHHDDPATCVGGPTSWPPWYTGDEPTEVAPDERAEAPPRETGVGRYDEPVGTPTLDPCAGSSP